MSDQTNPPESPQSPQDPWTRQDTAAPGAGAPGGSAPPEQAAPAKAAAGGAMKEGWERETINKLLGDVLGEQRKARRWGILFKSLTFIYLFLLLFYLPGELGAPKHIGKHTALVELNGVIEDGGEASADVVIQGLRDSFEDRNTAGIILRINSPGGSPVQAGYINDEINRLREKYPNTPLYAVVTDVCASGGYYVAAAADEIYADKASIVGSIGVLMDGFGFTDAMKKLGVERRLITAGENKGFLDPFSPIKQEDVMHVRGLLQNIHKQFIDVVKEGRGGRLKENPDLFSGLVWTGEQAVELGLADGLGSAGYVAREIIGEEKIIDFTPQPNYLDRFAQRLGVAIGGALPLAATATPQLK
jgi:protease-4